MGDVKQLVETRIKGKKVVVFAKTTCGYCKHADSLLKKHIGKEISKDEYDIFYIDKESRCQAIQTVLGKITGQTTVPRVFINGEFVGGCSEIENMEKRGQLAVRLKS